MGTSVNNYSWRENKIFEMILLSKALPKLDTLYRGMFRYIEQQAEPNQRARLKLAATRQWRIIDNRLGELLGRPLHRYCGCDISNGKMPSPDRMIDSSLKGKSATLYSWPFGGGHDVVQAAMAERLARAGMHVHNVDAFRDVLKRFDILLKMTCGKYSSGNLVNDLIRNKYWRILSLINWYFDGEKPVAREKKITLFQRSILKRGKPDLVVTCFDRYVSAIEKACARLNIPVVSFAADFDPRLCSDIRCPGDIENGRFARSVMFPIEDPLLQELQTKLNPEQVAFGGLPVRAPFLKTYSPEELNALRSNWEVGDGARVIVLMSGSEGVKNPLAKFIAQEYSDMRYPIHLFVVCGRNEEQRIQLEKELSHEINSLVETRVLGWTEASDMGELEAMAADDSQRGAVISTKGGGGTLSESVAAGAPLLVQDVNPIPWEQGNIAFVCRNGFGMRFVKQEELLTQLSALLERRYEPKVNYRSKENDSFALSIRLIERLVSPQ